MIISLTRIQYKCRDHHHYHYFYTFWMKEEGANVIFDDIFSYWTFQMTGKKNETTVSSKRSVFCVEYVAVVVYICLLRPPLTDSMRGLFVSSFLKLNENHDS